MKIKKKKKIRIRIKINKNQQKLGLFRLVKCCGEDFESEAEAEDNKIFCLLKYMDRVGTVSIGTASHLFDYLT